eukprot:scaffold52379_cov60-Phaeocystis_antarctica.AAC.4
MRNATLQQAQAERLTLVVAESKTGYFGVSLIKPGQPKPYQARVWRDGKDVSLGCFATAEEAALCVARTPEGQAAAQRAAVTLVPLTCDEARQQAQAEELTLRVADNNTGYFGVSLDRPRLLKRYQARVKRGGKIVRLGHFATAEEAALRIARSPEGQEMAARAAALTSEEARQQAQAEGLTLRVSENNTGYLGVTLNKRGSKPYQARVWRGGKDVRVGSFATAEEAALCVARSPEGQAAAERVASAARPLKREEEGKGVFFKEEGMVPPMPTDAYVKVEVVVKEEERSGSRPKRRRTN